MENLTLEQALFLIKEINIKVRNQYYTDKEAIEEIVKTFELFGIDCGARSDKTPLYYILTEE